MILKKIKENAQVISHPTRWSRGSKYYKDEYVFDIDILQNKQYLRIEGQSDSSNYTQEYTSILILNLANLRVENTNCECMDYIENKDRSISPYMCKHLVATLLQGLQEIKDEQAQEVIEEIHKTFIQTSENEDSSVDIFDLLENLNTEKVNLEVYMKESSKNPYTEVEFKIGNNKMYVLRNIKDFVYSRVFGHELQYGKDFIFNPNKHYFSEVDENIVSLLEENQGIQENIQHLPPIMREFDLVNGKKLHILGKGLKRFLLALEEKSINYTVNNSEYKVKILNEELPISFKLEKNKDEMILTSDDDMPKPLNARGDVFFYKGNIYLPPVYQYESYRFFYEKLKTEYKIKFDKSQAQDVITKVIPKLNIMSSKVCIDEEIEAKIKKDLEVKFYLDRKKDDIFMNLEFIYCEEKENDKYYVIKDLKKEELAKSSLENMRFIQEGEKFIFHGNEENLFEFLFEDIKKLKAIGEVYYSDRFKYKVQTSSVQASINDNEGKFLEINFDIENINKEEYKNILKSFKENRKYHKLKGDVLLNLQSKDIKELLSLLDNMNSNTINEINTGTVNINKNKSIYLEGCINENNLEFIKGRDVIKSISDKIKTSNSIQYKIPKNLNSILREYQVNGYKWFKTLDHYEFGGILADEMGLGKTLQTISFLASKKNSKSIVITPTSLIYNWKDEFENFTPNLKILIMHGSKNERIKLFDKIDEYDIVLTTYATLRNDFEYYQHRYFDYCIIDEAQNIKNPLAQNTQTVKGINAKVKFALTGTPIENNLIELWSIFDFIMPDYLFNKTKFEDKFMKEKENGIDDLKKLINPFILRRLKKDVLQELPDKIEKKFFVEMTSGQKKAYKALIEDINDKRKNPEFKEDKITIFSYLTKLRQLCLDPSILIEGYNEGSSKIDACIDILKENIEQGHKILLFSQFTSVLKSIGQNLETENLNYSYLDGSIKANKRLELVKDFNESDKNKVFLISLKAGGTGLNLTSADIVIHFDPWWNPSVEDQATDRAHRFGQRNVVEVIKLISKGTIEEKIIKMQDNKKELISNVMNGDMTNASALSSLSEEEINKLFEI